MSANYLTIAHPQAGDVVLYRLTRLKVKSLCDDTMEQVTTISAIVRAFSSSSGPTLELVSDDGGHTYCSVRDFTRWSPHSYFTVEEGLSHHNGMVRQAALEFAEPFFQPTSMFEQQCMQYLERERSWLHSF